MTSYIFKSAQTQFSIMWARVPLEKALEDPRLDETQKAKLQKAANARVYALQRMGLKGGSNYTRFSYLDRPYVTYVVSAAPAWKLEHHQWNYPLVGKMPYKGFASEADARREEKSLQAKGLETFLRGVTAYSTLGWFEDPILSTMLAQSEHQLVNLIIHETTHATLYIKNSADFNERLAVFVGNKGTEEYYLSLEGAESPTLQRIRDLNEDDERFSRFIGPEIQQLKDWYEALPENERDPLAKAQRIRSVQDRFTKEVLPKMKTNSYRRFPELELNNARLLYYRTYMQDLGDFEKLYEMTDSSWPRYIKCLKTLERHPDPERGLKDLLRNFETSPCQ